MATQPIEFRDKFGLDKSTDSYRGVGRPSGFSPDIIGKVEALCEAGATDDEIADFLDISTRTLLRWKHAYPDFCRALTTGKQYSDERTQRSLYHKANGFYVTEQQAFKVKLPEGGEELKVIEVQKFIPPDTTAQIFWLKNRRKEVWRDRHEVDASLSVSTQSNFDVRLLSDEQREMLRQLLEAATPKMITDGEFTDVND